MQCRDYCPIALYEEMKERYQMLKTEKVRREIEWLNEIYRKGGKCECL